MSESVSENKTVKVLTGILKVLIWFFCAAVGLQCWIWLYRNFFDKLYPYTKYLPFEITPEYCKTLLLALTGLFFLFGRKGLTEWVTGRPLFRKKEKTVPKEQPDPDENPE